LAEIFARVETKYLLTLSQAEAVKKGLAERGFRHMDFGSPTVQSLYYDAPDHRIIRDSLGRPVYKEKLRLRAYGEPGALTQTFTEIKKKYNGVVYKRRIALPLEEAMQALRQGRFPEEAGQVGREALWLVRRDGLVPSAVIAYNRDAWFSPAEPGVRVTMDRDISFRNWLLNLNAPAENLPVLSGDLRLMEIKTGGALPLWLARLLNANRIRRIHFSKYGQAYRIYIRPRQEATERSEEECSTVSLPRGA